MTEPPYDTTSSRARARERGGEGSWEGLRYVHAALGRFLDHVLGQNTIEKPGNYVKDWVRQLYLESP